MSMKEFKVHAMRDDKRAMCGRRIGSEAYTGAHGLKTRDQASAADMRIMGVDCERCLKAALASVEGQQ